MSRSLIFVAIALIACGGGQTPKEKEPEAKTRKVPSGPTVAKGEKLFAQGKYAEAKKTLEAALPNAQDKARAHYDLGLVNEALGDAESAATSYRSALSLNADFLEAKENLAMVRLDLNQLEDAKALLQEITKDHPERAPSWLNLGIVLSALEDNKGASEALKKSLAIDKSDPETWFELGVLQRKAKAGAEARASFEQAAANREKNNLEQILRFSKALRSSGNAKLATELSKEAITLAGEDERIVRAVSFEHAKNLFFSEQRDEARSLLTSLATKGADAWILLAQLEQKSGDGARAKNAAKKYLEAEPEGPHAKRAKQIISQK